jgi:hypothetical protein
VRAAVRPEGHPSHDRQRQGVLHWRVCDAWALFYAAAALVIPEKVREDKQVRAVMRLTGLRHDAITKALAMRTDMDDLCCGWELLTTAGHHDAVDYSPLDR